MLECIQEVAEAFRASDPTDERIALRSEAYLTICWDVPESPVASATVAEACMTWTEEELFGDGLFYRRDVEQVMCALKRKIRRLAAEKFLIEL